MSELLGWPTSWFEFLYWENPLPYFGLPGAPRTCPTREHKSPCPDWQQIASQSGLRFNSPTAQPGRRGGGRVTHWDGRRVLPCRVSEGQAWVKNPWVYSQVWGSRLSTLELYLCQPSDLSYVQVCPIPSSQCYSEALMPLWYFGPLPSSEVPGPKETGNSQGKRQKKQSGPTWPELLSFSPRTF